MSLDNSARSDETKSHCDTNTAVLPSSFFLIRATATPALPSRMRVLMSSVLRVTRLQQHKHETVRGVKEEREEGGPLRMEAVHNQRDQKTHTKQ